MGIMIEISLYTLGSLLYQTMSIELLRQQSVTSSLAHNVYRTLSTPPLPIYDLRSGHPPNHQDVHIADFCIHMKPTYEFITTDSETSLPCTSVLRDRSTVWLYRLHCSR